MYETLFDKLYVLYVYHTWQQVKKMILLEAFIDLRAQSIMDTNIVYQSLL